MSPSKGDPEPGSSTSRIAIKGFSLSAKSSGAKLAANSKARHPPSSLGKRPRSKFGHGDDSDSEHEFLNRRHGDHEVVTGFGSEGAIKQNEKKQTELLVIPKMGNRNWKTEARTMKSRNLLPPEVQAARESAAREARDRANGVTPRGEGVNVINSTDGEIQWGLSVRKREKAEEMVEEMVAENENRDGEKTPAAPKAQEQEPEKPKTADEEALEALMGTRKEKKGPDLVIQSAPITDYEAPLSEQDAYKRSVQAAPDASTLEDYERVPVEEFGAALLRGMGWNGVKKEGAKESKKRQNLLGLGAKELKDAEDLGAWVQKSDIKRLNEKSRGGGASGGGGRRPKASEYKREKEKRDEKREERGGGSYRRVREQDDDRDRRDRRDRDRDYDRRR